MALDSANTLLCPNKRFAKSTSLGPITKINILITSYSFIQLLVFSFNKYFVSLLLWT